MPLRRTGTGPEASFRYGDFGSASRRKPGALRCVRHHHRLPAPFVEPVTSALHCVPFATQRTDTNEFINVRLWMSRGADVTN
jgi:hypothetical protein